MRIASYSPPFSLLSPFLAFFQNPSPGIYKNYIILTFLIAPVRMPGSWRSTTDAVDICGAAWVMGGMLI